ncbi:MAG: radical SAM protein [Deltaproteobacteria bacterium]|nr:MAG: radical SAM protein [Deltaproteobacteria bacterium]
MGVVYDVQGYAVHDGPGIRTAVFLKGCPLRCWWCHNPESQRPEPERDARGDWIGEDTDAASLVGRVARDLPFFTASGGGVTFTGGEPTAQLPFLLEALDRARAAGLHTALETCGAFGSRWLAPLAARVDLFLFDLKHVDADAHRRGTGVGNRRILANLTWLLRELAPGRVTPRVPVIPGFNADPASRRAIAGFLRDRGYRGPVHLMPYHGLARDKYARVGRAQDFRAAPALTAADRLAIAADLDGGGLSPVWGGA